MANGINYEERKKVKRPIFNVRDLELGYCTKKVLMQELTKPMHGRMYYTTDTHEFFFDFDGSRIPLNMTGDNADIEKALQQINDKIAQLDPSNIDKLSEQVNKAVSDVKTAQEEIKQAKSDVANAVKKAEDAAAAVSSKVDQSYVDNKVKDLATQSSVTELQNQLNQIKTVSSVETTEDGYTLTLSDGTQLVLKNGKDGVDGVDGESVVFTSSEKVDGVTTVVITDKDGEHTFQVNDGITPTIEIDQTTKHWFINGEDSGVVAEGQDGVDGVNGKDGVDGKDGITPTIEIHPTTKHWIINGVDSGIVAEGKDGEDASSSEYFELNVTDKNMILEGNNLSLKYGDDSTITEITPDTVVADEKDGLVTLSQVLELLKKKGDDVDYLYINGYLDGEEQTDIAVYNPFPIVLDENNTFTIEVWIPAENSGWTDNYYAVVASVDVPDGYTIDKQNGFKFLDETNEFVPIDIIENPRGVTKKYGNKNYNSYVRQLDDQWDEDGTQLNLVPVQYQITIKKITN